MTYITKKKVNKLEPYMVGMNASCIIGGHTINHAKIQRQRSSYYICQNKETGRDCDDKMGYKHSWTVAYGSKQDIHNNDVEDLFVWTSEWDADENQEIS